MTYTLSKRLVQLFLLFGVLATAITATAQTQVTKEPAISGYSPVSYFTQNKAMPGSPEFTVEHKGELYYLASASEVALFKDNPDQYVPRHTSCAYSLTYGSLTPLDPTNFKIVDGTLLLFHRSDNYDAQLAWDNSELDAAELMRRADANWLLLKF